MICSELDDSNKTRMSLETGSEGHWTQLKAVGGLRGRSVCLNRHLQDEEG